MIQKDPESAARLAARIVVRLIRQKPQAVLGLATGSTMIPFYRALIDLYRRKEVDFSQVTTFNLDEYAELSSRHPCSYHRYMQQRFVSQVNICPQAVHLPDGEADDLEAACASYEEEIARSKGIDLQVLGIGRNGHIGFNEPFSLFSSRTRIQRLAPETIEDNQRHFGPGEQVPRRVITMGIGTILESRRCLLLACGESKAPAVAAALEGPVTPMVPASALQFHRDARFILDRSAASHLRRWKAQARPAEQERPRQAAR